MALTPAQSDCVNCVDGPLLVSAGAGSGKTFMLTQRIATALTHPEKSGVTDIDQVLAITFTELAAGEIKARVRSTLRAAGLTEQALKVDACWISTIHGMCSRILHEHALELRLDPQFGLLDDTDRDRLLFDAINQAVAERSGERSGEREGAGDAGEQGDAGGRGGAGEREGAELGADGAGEHEAARHQPAASRRQPSIGLFSEYEGIGEGSAVRDMVESVIEAATCVRGGLDAIEVGPAVAPATAIAGDVVDAFDAIESAARSQISASGKQPAAVSKILDLTMDEGIGRRRFEQLASQDDTTYADVAAALARPNIKFGNVGKALARPNREFRLRYAQACSECLLGLAGPARDELLDLARRTLELFEAKKRALNVLDQDDLLKRALEAFETSPRVRAEYRDRFRLVMVDEFQDTSALQIAIIDHLTGANSERLCTVGDTQQSIYRFRGADVATYTEHKRHMRQECGALYRELDKNFRSHENIITFVNRVFSQGRVFGEGGEFIELTTEEAKRPSRFDLDVPRVDVVMTTGTRGAKNAPGVSTQERIAVEAQAICQRFAALHARVGAGDEGERAGGDADDERAAGLAAGGAASGDRDWKDMVILLGRMTNAETYAGALRAAGIPCIIAGGSIFSKAPEAQTVCDLACAVANPLDDAQLLALLTSEMFGLSPDELESLRGAHPRSPGALWRGLREVAGAAGGSGTAGDSGAAGEAAAQGGTASRGTAGRRVAGPRAKLAASILDEAASRARFEKPSSVLTNAILASGWLDRLHAAGPQGMAQAANVLKAVRMAEDFESDASAPRGMAGVAARMRAKFDEGMKEKPGALNAAGQNAVRIMTIHASKGLEFPVVALADFYGSPRAGGPLALETIGETVYLSLRPGASVGERGAYHKTNEYAGDFPKLLAELQATSDESGYVPLDDVEDTDDPAQAQTAGGLRRAIETHAKAEELAELRRKFYVGATRPREVLIIAANSADRKPGDDGSLYGSDIVEDLRRGMFGEGGDFETPGDGVPFGGTRPARCSRIRMVNDDGVVKVRRPGAPRADELEGESQSGAQAKPQPEPVPLDEYLAQELEGARTLASAGAGLPSATGAKRTSETSGTNTDATVRPGAGCVWVPEFASIAELEPVAQPCNPLRAGTFSYSSIARSHDADPTDADETPLGKRALTPAAPEDDGDAQIAVPISHIAPAAASARLAQPTEAAASARLAEHARLIPADPTSFGSAFHAAAQWMVETREAQPTPGEVPPTPSDDALHALALTWGLVDGALPRLHEALSRWQSSDVAREAFSHEALWAEAPIYVHLDGPSGEPLHLEGAIDLLCLDATKPAAEQRALVVDYKTGGSPGETPEQLREKHDLQARCYAYAVLLQGFAGVEERFVRVEQADPGTDQPQVVSYSFDRSQLQELADSIRRAYQAAGR